MQPVPTLPCIYLWISWEPPRDSCFHVLKWSLVHWGTIYHKSNHGIFHDNFDSQMPDYFKSCTCEINNAGLVTWRSVNCKGCYWNCKKLPSLGFYDHMHNMKSPMMTYLWWTVHGGTTILHKQSNTCIDGKCHVKGRATKLSELPASNQWPHFSKISCFCQCQPESALMTLLCSEVMYMHFL